jgi:YHS domain-containing protein
MFRAILYLLITVVVITVIRSVIGILGKAFGQLFQPDNSAPRASPTPTGGELKKDPVCGTFIAAASSLQKTVGGVTYYFCSPACRDQFKSL